MNICITGINGFVGKYLYKYLSKTNNIIGYDFKSKNNNLDEINVIIHLAGKAHDTINAKSEDYFKVNTELTKDIYNEFLNSSIHTFIILSSVKAVEDIYTHNLDENVTPNPCTDYGKSKLYAEQYILNSSTPKNKRYIILRPCMIHGPNNKGNLNLLYKYINTGLPWPLGSFNNKRSYCSIDNLCFIINEIINNKSIQSGIYNIADDEPLSTNYIIKNIGQNLNKHIRIIYFPKIFIKLITNICDIFKLGLTSDKLNKLTNDYTVDNNKIKKAINKDLPITSTHGLKITLDSFKNAL